MLLYKMLLLGYNAMYECGDVGHQTRCCDMEQTVRELLTFRGHVESSRIRVVEVWSIRTCRHSVECRCLCLSNPP
jgi:hypothetical protein